MIFNRYYTEMREARDERQKWRNEGWWKRGGKVWREKRLCKTGDMVYLDF